MDKIFRNLVSNPRLLFLIDSLGALATALLLGWVLRSLPRFFGMPAPLLTVLSVIALTFGLYSMLCFVFAGKKWRLFLMVIIISNILYCFLTAGLAFRYFAALTVWGRSYFVAEIAVIVALICAEIKALQAAR